MKKELNYKGIFVAGSTFLASGVVLTITLGPVGIGVLGVGIALMAIGLAHRDEWPNDK